MSVGWALVAVGIGSLACHPGSRGKPAKPPCGGEQHAATLLPGVRREQLTLPYWWRRAAVYGDVRAELLSPSALADHQRSLQQVQDNGEAPVVDLAAAVDAAALRAAIDRRQQAVLQAMRTGAYLDSHRRRFEAAAWAELSDAAEWPTGSRWMPALHVAPTRLQLRCGSTLQPMFAADAERDPRFDRNHCSQVRPGEVVQRLARWPNGMWLVRSASAFGWVEGGTSWSAALTPEQSEQRLQPKFRPLTRQAFLQRAWQRLHQPYGWGGSDGGLDCSDLVLDVFADFGLQLPRTSGAQALAGSFSVPVPASTSVAQRLQLIEAAQRHGITLLHFPGHIGIALGNDEDGRPMMLHALADYRRLCRSSAGATTRVLVDRVTVSDLRLGEGTPKGSLLERLQTIVVFGRWPGEELSGASVLRAPAPWHAGAHPPCRNGVDTAIWVSPAMPSLRRPLRIVATSRHDWGAVGLLARAPDGSVQRLGATRLAGPPHALVASLAAAVPGRWRVWAGEGERLEACHEFTVHESATNLPRRPLLRRWQAAHEDLYAAFVEQLFRAPEDDDALTWPDLHSLLRDPQRNLLHDHWGLAEDSKLRLQPDCADLPYFLRAYFAAKLGLPFAYRACSRGRRGQAPRCGPLLTAAASVDGDAVAALQSSLRAIANTVHAAGSRTAAEAEESDLYPVALTRQAIRPGTVYVDPYGHLLVVSRWQPQGAAESGALLAADAQPDGTIGRRRFWQGSFLFIDDKAYGGVGFKAWRPLERDDEGQMRALDNASLRRPGAHAPFSLEPSQLRPAHFYARIETLIDPRPLSASARLQARLEALHEVVLRRVSSVANGEAYMRAHSTAVIAMPDDAALFQTQGAWEDYATPARDMRLLIGIDALLELHPGSQLAQHSFSYMRSDGSTQTLTLQDAVDRAGAFEIAYNPNDCVERRWGAAEGSAEMATCRRHAPAAQRARMQQIRGWFRRRLRPNSGNTMPSQVPTP